MTRKTFRLKTLFSVRCCLPEPCRIIKGIIQDIGMAVASGEHHTCGCSLNLFETDLGLGDTCHMTLLFPDADIEVNAVARRKRQGETPGDTIYGMEFTDLSGTDKAFIEDWLVAHAQEVEFPAYYEAEEYAGADGRYTG